MHFQLYDRSFVSCWRFVRSILYQHGSSSVHFLSSRVYLFLRPKKKKHFIVPTLKYTIHICLQFLIRVTIVLVWTVVSVSTRTVVIARILINGIRAFFTTSASARQALLDQTVKVRYLWLSLITCKITIHHRITKYKYL